MIVSVGTRALPTLRLLDLQREVTQAFDQNRQDLKKELLSKADKLWQEAQDERKANGGVETVKSRDLEQQAKKLSQNASYIDVALGSVWGGGDLGITAGLVVAQHGDYFKNAAWHTTGGQVYKIDCSGAAAQYLCKDLIGDESIKDKIGLAAEPTTKDKAYFDLAGGNLGGQVTEIYDLSELEGKGKVVVSNPGIYNYKDDAFRNAVKQNPEAAANGTLYVVLNNPTYEVIPGLSEVGFYALYDKINDTLGAKLPITNAEMKNAEIKAYAQKNKIEIDTSNHSRGGITESVSDKYLYNLGIKDLSISKSRYFGTATNLPKVIMQKQKNGYVDENGISPTVFASGNSSDFVNYLVGNNPTTGGLGGWYPFGDNYSHSSYFGGYKAPSEFLKDINGVDVLYQSGEKKGDPVINPLYDQYKKNWPVSVDGKNNSVPPALVMDKDNNIRIIDREGNTTIMDSKYKVIQKDVKTKIHTKNGVRYFELDGKKYHADPY